MPFAGSGCAAPPVQAVDGEFESLAYSYAPGVAPQQVAVHGERSLWCAVIERAFIDLGAIAPATPGSLPARPALRGGSASEAAARWLLHDRKDFPQVCLLAGVSAGIIRQAALAFYMLHHDSPR